MILYLNDFYPHLAYRHVWIYRLRFVILFVRLPISPPSGVKFFTVVHRRRPGQGISHFEELCSPEAPPEDENGVYAGVQFVRGLEHAWSMRLSIRPGRWRLATRRIGMCGYTAVPDDGSTRRLLWYLNK